MGSVSRSWVTAGHEIESEAGMCKTGNPTFSVSWPDVTKLIKNDSMLMLCPISLSIS